MSKRQSLGLVVAIVIFVLLRQRLKRPEIAADVVREVRAGLVRIEPHVAALAARQGFAWAAPPDGLFGWLDVGVDTERVAQPMLDAGWLTAPGALFSATRAPGSLMRINLATSQDPAFWRQLRACADDLRGRAAPP